MYGPKLSHPRKMFPTQGYNETQKQIRQVPLFQLISVHSIPFIEILKKTLKFGDKENLNLDEGDRIKLAWRSRHFKNCKYFLDCHY
jgi:hypothetical protein